MKTPLKIVQLRNGKFIAKRRGWFGWTTLTEVYDGNWAWHYSWSYLFKPTSMNDTFDSKEELVKALSEYYHTHRQWREVRDHGPSIPVRSYR